MKSKFNKVPDYVIQYSKGSMQQVSKAEAVTLIKRKGLPILLERVTK